MRNKAGQLAVVVPCEGADADIQSYGGKIVMPLRYAQCGLGGMAWHTEPELTDEFGNVIAWDDRELKPLGEPMAETNTDEVYTA